MGSMSIAPQFDAFTNQEYLGDQLPNPAKCQRVGSMFVRLAPPGLLPPDREGGQTLASARSRAGAGYGSASQPRYFTGTSLLMLV